MQILELDGEKQTVAHKVWKKIVLKWVKVNGGKISKNMKKTIKPITLVGFNEDILVYTAKL